jgi:hypothetical protein
MIWNTRRAAHAVLKIVKMLKFWLYGYTNPHTHPSRQIFSKDVAEVHRRIVVLGAVFVLCFVVISFRLIIIFSLTDQARAAPFGSSPTLIFIGIFTITMFAVLTFYFLGKMPLYVARALMWVARGNHERKIGFLGLGVLCIGFVLQAAVNLM